MVIAIEIEHFKEILAMFFGEYWVFSDNFSIEDCFLILLGKFFSACQHQTQTKKSLIITINSLKVLFHHQSSCTLQSINMFTRLSTITILSFLLVLNISFAQQKPVSCLNPDGKPIDWYVIYAAPKAIRDADGVGYLYYDSQSSGDWTPYPYPSDHTYGGVFLGGNSAHLNTVNQIKDQNLPFLAWNGQAVKNEDYTDNDMYQYGNAHSKFFMTLKNKTGFAISHSNPRYPQTDLTYGTIIPQVRDGEKILAQDIFCFNIDQDMAYEIYNKSCHIHPYIYHNTLFTYKCKDYITTAEKQKYDAQKFLNSTFSYSNYKMKIVYKNYQKVNRVESDIFIEGIVEVLKSSIVTGDYNTSITKSTCKPDYTYQVENSLTIIYKRNAWYRDARDDHAKWAVTENTTNHYACFGDLNRDSTAQWTKGGSFFCLEDSGLKCAMRSLIGKKESCNIYEDSVYESACGFDSNKGKYTYKGSPVQEQSAGATVTAQ